MFQESLPIVIHIIFCKLECVRESPITNLFFLYCISPYYRLCTYKLNKHFYSDAHFSHSFIKRRTTQIVLSVSPKKKNKREVQRRNRQNSAYKVSEKLSEHSQCYKEVQHVWSDIKIENFIRD